MLTLACLHAWRGRPAVARRMSKEVAGNLLHSQVQCRQSQNMCEL